MKCKQQHAKRHTVNYSCNLNNIIDTIVNGNDNNDNEIATLCQLCRVYIASVSVCVLLLCVDILGVK